MDRAGDQTLPTVRLLTGVNLENLVENFGHRNFCVK